MEKSKKIVCILCPWLVFGVLYYEFVLPNPNGLLKTSTSILFCVLLAFTTQVVLVGLFTQNQRHFGLALLSGFFLLDVWSLTHFAENESLLGILFGTPDKEPLIGALGVLGLIFAISVLWYTPERPYPRWRGILNMLISITGLIGLLHMQKTGFAAWHPMASIAVYAAWLLCVTEMLCHWLKRLVVMLKAMYQRAKARFITACSNAVASVSHRYQRLCVWMLGILANAKQLLLKLLVYAIAAVLWLMDRCRQYYPPLKKHAERVLYAIVAKLKAMLQ